MSIPPSQFMGRPTVTTTVVTGTGKDMVTRTTTASPWTPEDQALMLAWREYQFGIHDRCGQPLAISTHPFMEGWYDVIDELTCWACTAMAEPGADGTRTPVTFPMVVDTYDHDADPLPPMPELRRTE